MTGAGSVDHAFVKEDSFKTLPGTPTYYEPGRNPTVQDLTLERALQRQRQPNKVWATQSIAQNLEGAFAVEFTMDSGRQSDVHDIVFNSTSPYTLASGRAASSTWYIGLEYLPSGGGTSTAERQLTGCVPIDYTITYQQGGSIRVAITFIYADENYNTSVTPSSINEATGDSAQFHGFDLTIDGTTQDLEETATLSISNMSRFQRGSQAIAQEAVVGPAQATLDFEGVFNDTNNIELGYGGSGQTSTSKNMSEVSGSAAYNAANSTIATYSFGGLKPTSYSWDNLFDGDADVTESVQFHVTGDPAVSV